MRRCAWLVALPWAVVITSEPFRSLNHPDPENYQVQYRGDPWAFECPGKGKEACEDFVDAMNAAHERLHPSRSATYPPLEIEFLNRSDEDLKKMKGLQ